MAMYGYPNVALIWLKCMPTKRVNVHLIQFFLLYKLFDPTRSYTRKTKWIALTIEFNQQVYLTILSMHHVELA